MHDAGKTEFQPVLTLEEARELIRATSDEYARRWLKLYAPGAILPGGRLRVSRERLMAVINGKLPIAPPEVIA